MDNLDTIKGLIEEVLKPIVSTAIKDAMPQHNADLKFTKKPRIHVI